ncbi:hypothetical protein ACFPT7_21640 [Acidicapsa dinghuensis]|uniref:Uncharacterized protein n=1 Tax=Acidicapsa dinghuensis TaxID=2218256 RepID=A0ABW1EKV6_9BACT|nr:hypothetical protein [Acidicapsa dinghuensis]
MLPITGIAEIDEGRGRSRKVSREAGRGLEILGHAIGYLSDEFALECMAGKTGKNALHSHVAAIDLLKMLNREVYFSCPIEITLEERIQGWISRLSAPRHTMRPALLPVKQRTRW